MLAALLWAVRLSVWLWAGGLWSFGFSPKCTVYCFEGFSIRMWFSSSHPVASSLWNIASFKVIPALKLSSKCKECPAAGPALLLPCSPAALCWGSGSPEPCCRGLPCTEAARCVRQGVASCSRSSLCWHREKLKAPFKGSEVKKIFTELLALGTSRCWLVLTVSHWYTNEAEMTARVRS